MVSRMVSFGQLCKSGRTGEEQDVKLLELHEGQSQGQSRSKDEGGV